MSVTNVQFKIEKIKDTENYANRWDTVLKFTYVGFIASSMLVTSVGDEMCW